MRIVLTSVNYADYLAVTLEAWKRIVPFGCLSVATSPEDTDSQAIAAEHAVPVVVTDAWSRIDPTCHHGDAPGFNMAYGLDVSLGLVGHLIPPPRDGEVCGHVNPDCYPFGTWPKDDAFKSDTVYGFWRYGCETHADLVAHLDGKRARKHYPRLKNTSGWPIGYCQMFRWTPGRRFGSYPTAGKFDTNFARGFTHQQMLDDVYLLHLGPISVRENWAGRVVPAWA